MANLNFNRVIIGGRLTAKPELKQTPGGTSVTNFSVAVNHRVSNDKTETDFIDVTAWGKTAEFVCKYFHKGSSIMITGELRQKTGTEDDKKRSSYYVNLLSADFVDSKSEANSTQQQETAQYSDIDLDELGDDEDMPF